MHSAKETLHKLGLAAKKRLGQNFLTNEDDLRFIAGCSSAVPGEKVIEIGPGLGALTAFLLEKGFQVAAVEKDYNLVTHLKNGFKDAPLEIFCLDVLKFDIHQALKIEKPLTVFGNIPYNITTPIVFWLVDQRAFVKSAVLMTQKEVAERLAGTPGHDGWGAVSVSLQAYADVHFLRVVPKGHFFPAPKVDSAVIRLDFLPKPRFDEQDKELFHTIVARAFQKRRKTLLNALENEAAGHDRSRLAGVFGSLGFDPQRRPETLSVPEWVLLARALREML